MKPIDQLLKEISKLIELYEQETETIVAASITNTGALGSPKTVGYVYDGEKFTEQKDQLDEDKEAYQPSVDTISDIPNHSADGA